MTSLTVPSPPTAMMVSQVADISLATLMPSMGHSVSLYSYGKLLSSRIFLISITLCLLTPFLESGL